MARIARGKPFRNKKDGVEFGSYRVYIPSQKKVVSLDTQDLALAQVRAFELTGIDSAVAAETSSPRFGDRATVPQPVTDEPIPGPRTDFDAVENPISNGAQAVIDWATRNTDDGSEPGATPNSPNTPEPAAAAGTGQHGPDLRVVRGGVSGGQPNLPVPRRAKKGTLTPEQSERIAGAMKSIVTKVNLIADEQIVKFLGRNPYQLEDEDLELLSYGWELQLAQFFGDKPMPPWVLILAGNLMVVFAMYMRGTPIPRAAKSPIPKTPPRADNMPMSVEVDLGTDWGKTS